MPPTDTEEKQATESQAIPMQHAKVFTVKSIGALVGPQTGMSSRREGRSGWLNQKGQETSLRDHVNHPLKKPKVSEIIMLRGGKVKGRSDGESNFRCSG